jgi:ubiquinone/menaquinone biosynthesis C-methylase UbiE
MKMNKALWRAWYGFLAWYGDRRGARFACMNWGYDDGRPLVGPEAGPERYPLQLYHALVEKAPVAGKHLLDVSCGRGGGLHYLTRAFGPAEAVGLDFTPGNVRLAERAFGATGLPLSFRQGDAETLEGVADGSIDVVMSVEASHCYPRLDAFLASARRVLAPGGHLVWTDFYPADAMDRIRALWAPHFDVVEERDVTAEVLAGMRADRDRRQALIEGHATPWLRPVMRNFAAADDGCDTVQRFVTGSYTYFMVTLRARG